MPVDFEFLVPRGLIPSQRLTTEIAERTDVVGVDGDSLGVVSTHRHVSLSRTQKTVGRVCAGADRPRVVAPSSRPGSSLVDHPPEYETSNVMPTKNRRMSSRRAVGVLVCVALLAAPVLAHVPGTVENNDSPGTAYYVSDPAKSWAFYDGLEEGGVAYYQVRLDAGERLRVSLSTPSAGEFTPSVVLLSDRFETATDVPPWVSVPNGWGAEVVAGERPGEADYEPFAPSSAYQTVAIDRRVEEGGTYMLAVYEPERRAGQVGVAVGYEERFTPVEYATVPIALVDVRLWSGQHPLVVFGPLLAVLGVGVASIRPRWSRWRRPWLQSALSVAALLYIGSAVGTAVQMAFALSQTGWTPAALVTAGYVLVPLLAGRWLFRTARESDFALPTRTRAALVVAGLVGLATWGGLVVGPAIALAAALTPAADQTEPPPDTAVEPGE
jgi:hypothetical protein